MITKIKQLWNKVTRQDTELDMEIRIFNAVSVITVIYLIGMAIINILESQILLSLVLTATAVVVSMVYGFVQKKREVTWGVRTLAAISYPILSINFYFNEGIEGPSSYVFLLIHLIILTISDRKEFWLWGIYNFLFFSALFYIDNFHPELIPESYGTLQIKFADHLITYISCIIGIGALISVLKWNYQKQKNISDEKSRAYEQVNISLTRSMEQKNKIIALISHDLKSPLISITRILEMIKEGELSEEETKSVQHQLYIQASNAQKLAESILEWATIELRSSEANLKPVNIKHKLEHILNVYHALAAHKNIHFSHSFSGSTDIVTDIERLSLIMRNLFQNAIKFTPEEGSIAFSFLNKGDELVFKVSDSGVGIHEEKIKMLFDKHFRSTRGTASEKGHGIGLFICQENAKKIGGHLSAASKLGEGSIFTLVLPARPNNPS